MSAEKNKIKSSKVETRKLKDESGTEDQQARPSAFGTLVRGGLILALVFYMLKPYLFDKPQIEEGKPQNFIARGETMGTTWNAIVCATPQKLLEVNSQKYEDDGIKQAPNGEPEADPVSSCEGLLAGIIQRQLDLVDKIASTYKADSEVSTFNRSKSTDWFPVSKETAEIVALAREVSQETNGAFDITVAPLVNMYRFGPNKSPLVSFPTDAEIEKARANVGLDKYEVRMAPEPALRKTIPELTIDLSGVAKGFAVDKVCQALEEVGLTDYMIEVGGEIRCRGTKVDPDDSEKRLPWRLGVQTPEVVASGSNAFEQTPDIYRMILFDSADRTGVLATSGDYHNFLQVGDLRFSHIIDPRTGKPTEMIEETAQGDDVERLGSVSIVSTAENELSCARADAYATAFFVLGENEGVPLADQLNIAALYLYRSDDSASNVRETASKSFSTGVNIQKVGEVEKSAEDEEDGASKDATDAQEDNSTASL